MVKVLLKNPSTDVNIKNIHTGNTPLIRAIRLENKDIVKVLLEHQDIDPNIASIGSNDTALIHAANRGYSEGIELLLQHKHIDVNKRNTEGITALEITKDKEDRDSETLIKDYCGKINIPYGHSISADLIGISQDKREKKTPKKLQLVKPKLSEGKRQKNKKRKRKQRRKENKQHIQ